MKKEVWILLSILAIILFFALFVHEGFQATDSIRQPPFTGDEQMRVFNMLSNSEQTTYKNAAIAKNPNLKDLSPSDLDTLRKTDPSAQDVTSQAASDAAADFNPVMKQFYDSVFTPATTALTQTDIDTFLAKNPPTTNKINFSPLLKRYFVDQQGIGNATQSVTIGPTGSQTSLSYADLLKDVGESAGYSASPTGPVGVSTMSSSPSQLTPPASPTGPVGMPGPLDMSGYNALTGATGATGNAPGIGGAQATTSGTTTGGSTTISGPNNLLPSSGGLGVFGPVFTGAGTITSGTNGDSTKTSTYPQLLGGGIRTPSTRIDGVGITAPSSSSSFLQGPGSSLTGLPTPDMTGSSENSQYLPYSRTPGDQDQIPDPYRVSKTFKQSTNSYKPEPTPFLTDFSAFQK